ncbi:AMP-binding protein [Streptomyces sp. MST-110588]|uniref:AMP-binding protein n=1 Tax=Streptomyces sp. MST-110588 TaxID=2833628 RepID=UPI001F5C9F83|nr:AMP-binding protein [Streptomyces sp. MST-110588]UNO41519.1 AMP-binding protein [Streptomyces sp. MST-110588]
MLRRVTPQQAGTQREAEGLPLALTWTGEPGRVERLTHGMLLDQAARATTALRRLGVRDGDRVAVHLPLVPESVIATMACGRLGAVRTSLPVSATAAELADLTKQCGARVVITANAGFWDGAVRPVKPVLDRALRRDCPDVRSVLVVNRSARPVAWTPGRDHWWHEALATR